MSSGATSAHKVSVSLPDLRTSAISGTTSEAGSNPSQAGAPPPSGANAKPPTATGAPGPSTCASATSARQAATVLPKRPAPLAVIRVTSPSAAIAAPSRSGCSKQNQGSPGRREANASALGSSSPASGSVKEQSRGPPLRRERASARSRCAARRGAASAGICPASSRVRAWPSVAACGGPLN